MVGAFALAVGAWARPRHGCHAQIFDPMHDCRDSRLSVNEKWGIWLLIWALGSARGLREIYDARVSAGNDCDSTSTMNT
jgi:hypothetical protein